MDDPRVFSSQGVVLLLVVVRPGITVREIADSLSLTYRTVWSLVGELRKAGLLNVKKKGRRHYYFINVDAPVPHPLISHMTMGDVVSAIFGSPEVLPPGDSWQAIRPRTKLIL